MVDSPEVYRWSSYHRNALGKPDHLIQPHRVYDRLAETDPSRLLHYRELFREALDVETVEAIRYGSRKGLPVGTSLFKTQIEQALGQRLGSGKRGRPRKPRLTNGS